MSDSEKNFITRLVDFKSWLLKSEVVRIGFPVFGAILLILFLLPFLFNNSALKAQLSQKISQSLEADFKVFGKVQVAFLPVPTITLNKVLITNYRFDKNENRDEKIYNLYAKKLKIRLKIFKVSQGSAINKMIFVEPILQSYYRSNDSEAREDKLSEIFDKISKDQEKKDDKNNAGISAKLFSVGEIKFSNIDLKDLPKVEIVNGQIISYDKSHHKNEFSSLGIKFDFRNNRVISSGGFLSGNTLSEFNSDIRLDSNSKKPDSFFEIESSSLKMKILGNFSKDGVDSGRKFSGKIDGQIIEFKNFYKSYINNSGKLSDKFRANGQAIKISADVVGKEEEIAIDNLVLDSSLISGEGSLNIDFSGEFPALGLNLNLAKIDLNSFLSDDALITVNDQSDLKGEFDRSGDDEVAEFLTKINAENSAQQAEDGQKSQIISEVISPEAATEKSESKSIEILKNFDLDAEIKVDTISLFSGEIKDSSIYLTISKKGEILVEPVIFHVPGEGVFRAWGVVDNSGALPKFVGKFDLSGKSFEDLLRWLGVESQSLKFGNLKQYHLYSDLLFTPNLSRFGNFYLGVNDGASELSGEFYVDKSDKISNIKGRFRGNIFKLDDYFMVSDANIYLNSGLLIKKVFWLNDIVSNVDIDAAFDKFIYADEEFIDQKMHLKFGRGYIRLEGLVLSSEKTKLSADMMVDITNQSPQFTLNIAADNFHYEDPQEEEDEKDLTQKLFDRFLKLPSLDGFGGNVNISFNNFDFNQRPIKNLKFQSRLISGDFKNVDFSCEAYGGKLEYKGFLGIGLNKKISGNINASNVAIGDILTDFFDLEKVSGVANISANISASSDNKSDFKKSLNSQINFSVNAPKVTGYGLENLVQKMFAPQQNSAELQEPEKIILNPDYTTTFDKAEGSAKIENGAGKINAKISGTLTNAVLSGSVDLNKNNANLLFNAIFLTGTRKKPVPINVASSISGDFSSLSQSLNLNQVRQYFGLPIIAAAAVENVEKPSGSMEEMPVPDALKSQIIQPNQNQ